MPHHIGGDREEMRPVAPVDTVNIDQPQIGFIDQRGSLQGIARAGFSPVAAGNLVQLAVNERDQLLLRGEVAACPGLQEPCDFGGFRHLCCSIVCFCYNSGALWTPSAWDQIVALYEKDRAPPSPGPPRHYPA